jgi:DNA-binding transcriptional LysR family regulator
MISDLNDFVVFAKVVDLGSFTAAGRQLELPKSTVSRRISRLEAQLGMRLLQRTTRQLKLTDAGAVFYERCRKISADAAEAEREIANLQATPQGRLRFTAPLEMGQTSTPLILAFLERYPEVDVEVELTDRYVNLIDEGFDVALRAGKLADSSLIAKKLEDAQWVLVASPHYLESKGSVNTAAELERHDAVLFSPQSKIRPWYLASGGKTIHVRPQGRFAINHLDSIKSAVVAGLGVAQLPLSLCERDLKQNTLVELLPETRLSVGSIWIVYPSANYLPTKVRAFVDFVSENYANAFDPDAIPNRVQA